MGDESQHFSITFSLFKDDSWWQLYLSLSLSLSLSNSNSLSLSNSLSFSLPLSLTFSGQPSSLSHDLIKVWVCFEDKMIRTSKKISNDRIDVRNFFFNVQHLIGFQISKPIYKCGQHQLASSVASAALEDSMFFKKGWKGDLGYIKKGFKRGVL